MAEKSYTRFVINGKEQELKFCLQALRLLDENGGRCNSFLKPCRAELLISRMWFITH